MTELIIIASGLLPALALWFYIWRQDPQPEPFSWLAKAVIYGACICLPVSVIEYVISAILFGPGGGPTTLTGTTIDAFFVAALPEEACKLVVLWLILRRNPYFDEHFDGIVYAVCVGLGFAAVENVSYLFGNLDEWQSVAFSRALLAVPGHYAFAVLMGYYYSLYHFSARSLRTKLNILLVPFLAHGAYDAIALSGTINPYIGGISFFILIYFCTRIHKMARRKMLAQLRRDQYGA